LRAVGDGCGDDGGEKEGEDGKGSFDVHFGGRFDCGVDWGFKVRMSCIDFCVASRSRERIDGLCSEANYLQHYDAIMAVPTYTLGNARSNELSYETSRWILGSGLETFTTFCAARNSLGRIDEYDADFYALG
jgi:hypothetical protein